MRFMRKAGLWAVLSLSLLSFGCGDVYRIVANPVFKPGGDPANFRYAVVVNNNNGNVSTATQVDLTGDTNIGNYPVGQGPMFAVLNSFQTLAFTANAAGDSVSLYSPTSPAGTPANTVTLPAGSRPVALAIANSGNLYVANSGTNTVGVIPSGQGVLTASIPVGPNPVFVAVLPDSSKVYCLNHGNGTVTVISTIDNTVTRPGVAVGRSPVSAIAKPDGSAVYVANQGSNSVSVISSLTDSVIATLPVGGGPSFLFYDKRLGRLYVVNTSGSSITVFDTSGTGTPVLLGTVPVGAAPLSIAVLGDGSRAYVANSGDDTVTVIDAASLTVKSTIQVGENPVFIATAPGNTRRVIVANHGLDSHPTYGTVSDIDTSTDTVISAGDGKPYTLQTGSPRPVFIAVTQ